AIDDLAAVLGGHAGAEAVPAGAHEFARLERTFHRTRPRRARFLSFRLAQDAGPDRTGNPACRIGRAYMEKGEPSQRDRPSAAAGRKAPEPAILLKSAGWRLLLHASPVLCNPCAGLHGGDQQ